MTHQARHRSQRTRCWIVGICAVMLLAGVGFAARGTQVDGRIVAIADIHGAYDELVDLLLATELIDQDHHWIGGRATLVQTGDFLDRGADVHRVMDLLRSLQVEAPEAGGEVVVLLGNHEAMNLLGFLRDVGEEAYANFAVQSSEERQRTESKRFGKWLRQRAKRKKERAPRFGHLEAAEFAKQHPPGYFEYQDAVRPGGKYGDWLRSLPMIAERQGIVFLHGGISPTYTNREIADLNQKMREEIALLDGCREQLLSEGVIFSTSNPNEMVVEGLAEIATLTARLEKAAPGLREPIERSLQMLSGCVGYEDWFLVKGESPIWYRGFAKLEGEEALKTVTEALEGLHADRFVVGHTPQTSKRVERRLDGRVFLLDTGMLTKVYRGRPSALEFVGDRVTAIYIGEREVLEDGPAQEEETTSALGAAATTDAQRSRAVLSLSPGTGGLHPLAPLMAGVAVAALGVEGATGLGYVDEHGKPLPFDSEDELVAFLMRGALKFGDQTDVGVNRPYKVTVTADGITIDAVFRSVDKLERNARTKTGRRLPHLRDSYRFEPAAYQINRILGLDRLPAAVLRTVRGKRGSLQVWMHGMIDEEKRLELGIRPQDTTGWRRQIAEQKLFDRLVANVDRNQGNLLINRDTEKIWLIDHTRAFAEMSTPENLNLVTRCKRPVYEALVAVTEGEIRAAMKPYLLKGEMDTLWARWEKISKRLQVLVKEHGEEVILY